MCPFCLFLEHDSQEGHSVAVQVSYSELESKGHCCHWGEFLWPEIEQCGRMHQAVWIYTVAEFLLIPSYRLELYFFSRIHEREKQAKILCKSEQ